MVTPLNNRLNFFSLYILSEPLVVDPASFIVTFLAASPAVTVTLAPFTSTATSSKARGLIIEAKALPKLI